MNVFDGLLDLLLPCKCSLCGQAGQALCSSCESSLNLTVRPVERFGLHGFSAGEYGRREAALVRSFKEKQLTALGPFLAKHMVPALERFALETQSERERGTILVPIPSSRSNYLKRGYVPSEVLAKNLNRLAGRPARVIKALKFCRAVEDQSGLGTQERMTNLGGSMVGLARLAGERVLLVDDVVTTGATIFEAARAARQSGAEVLGFLTFSETILKMRAKNQK